MRTPFEDGFTFPAEWTPHATTLLAWPYAADLWEERLAAAQTEWVALCRSINRGEPLTVLVPDAEEETAARAALGDVDVTFWRIGFGDIWMRDIAPLVLTKGASRASAVFRFNGWGGKYELPGDDAVSAKAADALGFDRYEAPFVMEGGSVDVDGEGTVLTTEQCLLNDNRNPGRSRMQIEADLRDYLGAKKTVWITEGLANDHTDGHVDTIARFVRPGVVMVMAPSGDDPNRDVLEKIAREVEAATDAAGRKLEVVRIPSPGRLIGDDGEVMPASYVNFYIGNRTVTVPQYGTDYDRPALDAIAKVFPDREVVGASARAILEGGGAFHCITQQVPKGAST
ncbi:MAG: agmatine deiminase family protein [Deltaproteobacteria bacterium]